MIGDAWITIGLFLSFFLGVAVGWQPTPKAISEAVAACEKDLPRSQKCNWKPVAFVVPTT